MQNLRYDDRVTGQILGYAVSTAEEQEQVMIMPFEGLQDNGQAEATPFIEALDEEAYCDAILTLLSDVPSPWTPAHLCLSDDDELARRDAEDRATLRDILTGGFAF